MGKQQSTLRILGLSLQTKPNADFGPILVDHPKLLWLQHTSAIILTSIARTRGAMWCPNQGLDQFWIDLRLYQILSPGCAETHVLKWREIPSGVIKHGWLENWPMKLIFLRLKPSCTSGIFQPAMIDETRGYHTQICLPAAKTINLYHGYLA